MTKVDACVSTEDPRICDASTMTMDLTVMCAAYTHTKPTKLDACVSTEDPRTCDASTVTVHLW